LKQPAKSLAATAMLCAIVAAASTTTVRASDTPDRAGGAVQAGQASWYGPGFHGRRTANGETFNTNALTAAHRTLPFGTRIRVTNRKTGRSVIVRVNDRGPYAHGRVIDLSRASAQAIGIDGVAEVSLSRV
jgi:rare lipoprotein A